MFENDSVSSVRFSCNTLSGGSVVVTGPGIGVGVLVLSGRKMVLNPRPVNVPAKADSGPRFGGSGRGAATARAVAASSTAWIEKFACVTNACSRGLDSLMTGPPSD